MAKKEALTSSQRKALYDVFKRYRAYKVAITTRTPPSSKGFAAAIHPDLIHGTSPDSSPPIGVSGVAVTPAFNAEAFRRFVWRIDYHVKQLPPIRRIIIRRRFLCAGKLPTDTVVHGNLRKEGWFVGESFYRLEKEKALCDLFKSLNSSRGAESG